MKPRRRKDWEALLEELKLLLSSMDIEYRETRRIKSEGGLCLVKGRNVVIVKRDLEPGDKAEIVKRGIASFDLDARYIKPEVRDFLEE